MPKITQQPTRRSSEKKVEVFDRFAGVDLTSGQMNVEDHRSQDAPNMMPSEDGFPKKRYGYRTIARYDGPIYAGHRFVAGGEEHTLIHAGTRLYDGDAVIYEGMAEGYSTAVQLGGKLWILDGKTFLYYDGETCAPVSGIATVPKITIAKDPSGTKGAESYMPINMLTGRRMDSFLATAGSTGDKVFVLSFGDLSGAALTVERLTAAGAWEVVASGYTVDRTAGKVTFTTAPAVSGTPVGQDNIQITYEVAKSRADTINKCKFCILYGVRGMLDRIFVTGNPEEPNIDYWSDFNDPAMIGDSFYGQLGQEGSPIVGYSVLGSALVAHKRGEENDRNVFLRTGQLDDKGFAEFPLSSVLQGEGTIAERAFGSLQGEPMYLTGEGVYALTSGDVTGERHVQGRSYFIKAALKAEQNLAAACAVNYDRYYVLAVGKRLYLLDGEQKVYVRYEPYSAHQFECYYWTDIEAHCLFLKEGRLCFGTADGRICRFYDAEQPGYNDDGKAIRAYWTIPLQNFERYGRLKTVTNVWVVGMPFPKSGGNIYFISDRNQAEHVGSYQMDIFSFANISFARFTFNTINHPAIVPMKKKAKKIKLFAVRVENRIEDETFGLQAVEIEYREGSKVKR